ncbi:hypothetical protein P3T76_009099 [Phytophthora citrophthora]|uniref:Uncharacterized protein n=1 Tax=Phytophthora citrophthora TaxID=4793 RepID=A0AAD9LKV1_9STRA|nr:hypothetical protein P3T76_009099 [Phytophthora citrophthora]
MVEGLNLEDPRTLSRNTFTTEILLRLEETRVLLVPSPPMTGRTSTALLICQSLVNGQVMDDQKKIVFNLSAFMPYKFETFEEMFKLQCGVDWEYATSSLPSQGRMMKLRCTTETLHDAIRLCFWMFVKSVVNNPTSNWFIGFSRFGGALPALEAFYDRLEKLTGGHVGVTASTVKEMNESTMEEIHKKERHRFPANQLQFFPTKNKKSSKWLTQREASALPAVPISFKPIESIPRWNQIHVLVVLPRAPGNSNVIWYGKQGFDLIGDDVKQKDPRQTMSRKTLTTETIRQLEEKHVFQVNSSPMTGKTSLAALVSQSLANEIQKTGVTKGGFNFSAMPSSENETFEEGELQATMRCRLGFRLDYSSDAIQTMIQELYNDGRSPPRCQSTLFWPSVKFKLGRAGYNVRSLMFDANGWDMMYHQSALDRRLWYQAVSCFEGASSALEEFCIGLEELTVDALNEVFTSRNRSSTGLPSPTEWIRMLQSGSLYQTDDNVMFERLTSTRAVKKLESISIGWNASRMAATLIINVTSLRNIFGKGFWFGVTGGSSSRLRLFAKKRLSGIVRGVDSPHTLPEMIIRAINSMDYGSIHDTPSTFKTSVDEGALFGSGGFLNLTVREDEKFGGVKLLQEGSNLADQVDLGGRYLSLQLSDFCLVDFRHDDVPMERIAHDCGKLFFRSNDVVLVYPAMDVYRISASKKQ